MRTFEIFNFEMNLVNVSFQMAFLRTDFRTMRALEMIFNMNSFVHSKTCTGITDDLTDVARINLGHI